MENPESKPKYLKLNENIEKWTGVFYFFITQMTIPAIFMPNLIISFYFYFATDLGAKAFTLPFPIWCVCHSFVMTERLETLRTMSENDLTFYQIFRLAANLVEFICKWLAVWYILHKQILSKHKKNVSNYLHMSSAKCAAKRSVCMLYPSLLFQFILFKDAI